MKIKLATALVICAVFMTTAPSMASRNISLPYEMKFDSGDNWTSDLAWKGTGGSCSDTRCSITHQSALGWNGGAAKIIPPQNACCDGINGCMCALGSFTGFSTTRLNIRALYKLGPTYYSSYRNAGGGLYNKFIDVHGGDTRFGILGLVGEGTSYCRWGILANEGCYLYNSNPVCHNNNPPAFKYDGTEHSGEWISVEYEIDSVKDTTTIYITESDGTFTTWKHTNTTTGNMNRIEIGGFYNPIFISDPGTYLLIDELKISNTYIGPPDGFVGKPSAPTDLRVIN
jgi:hypothetical protein